MINIISQELRFKKGINFYEPLEFSHNGITPYEDKTDDDNTDEGNNSDNNSDKNNNNNDGNDAYPILLLL